MSGGAWFGAAVGAYLVAGGCAAAHAISGLGPDFAVAAVVAGSACAMISLVAEDWA